MLCWCVVNVSSPLSLKSREGSHLRFQVPGSRFQLPLGGGCGETNGLFPFASPYKSEKIHGEDKQLRLKQNSKLC